MKRDGRYRKAAVRGLVVATAVSVLPAGCAASWPAVPGQLSGRAVTTACTRAGPPLGAGQLRAAYQAPPAAGPGVTGAGTVIAVIIPAAAPHVASDVAAYSRRYGLPVPRVRVLSYGQVPPPATADAAGWEQEGTMNLEMAHVLAPAAGLIYLAVPPGTDDGGTVPEDAALGWLVTRYQVTVVSFSLGIPEAWEQPGYQVITSARAGLRAAARAGTTVVASSGDYGTAEPGLGGHGLASGVAWPASDPLVTAVGGTALRPVRAAGRTVYASTAFTWTAVAGGHAGGAGRSAVFARPAFQDRVAGVTGPHRGVADISMAASDCTPVAAYASVGELAGQRPGWFAVSGTSVAAPLFAGAVADAAQAAGHALGVLGPALYQLHGPGDGITDITTGNNAMPGIPGYPARPGYDLPTGIGTITSIPRFSAALASAARANPA